MNKLYLIIFSSLVLFLVGCAPTPNNIVMSVNQGQCLTGGNDGSPVTNPGTAQYCMSVTVQNNNSGQNANNVQVNSSGFTLSYSAITSAGMQSYSSAICDNNASGGVCPSGTNQIGNITIYDPNNCATMQGSNVTTLMANGGTCTMFLQILAESYEYGSYPINLTYNYTNSNQNYSISTTVYQNVNVYAGGLSGSYMLNNGTWQPALLSSTKPAEVVNAMIHDNYGNLYFNSATNIFEYNGLNKFQLGTALGTNINSMTMDGSNNLIVGTGSGLQYYNVSTSSNWNALIDKNGQVGSVPILGVAYTVESTNSLIYVTESASSYSCVESITSGALGLACSNITASGPTKYYTNSIYAYNGSLYVGRTNAFESYLGAWYNYTLNPGLTGSSYPSSIFANNVGAYFGVNSNSLFSESSIYYCSWGSTSCSLAVSESGNSVTGNIYAITVDGAGNIYGSGSNVNSADFSSSNVNGVYESIITSGSSHSPRWNPIISNAESMAALTAVSSLVN